MSSFFRLLGPINLSTRYRSPFDRLPSCAPLLAGPLLWSLPVQAAQSDAAPPAPVLDDSTTAPSSTSSAAAPAAGASAGAAPPAAPQPNESGRSPSPRTGPEPEPATEPAAATGDVTSPLRRRSTPTPTPDSDATARPAPGASAAAPVGTAPPTNPAEQARAAGAEVDDSAPPSATTPRDAGGLRLIPSGSLFTRFELRRNYDDLGVSTGRFLEGDAVAARMRLGLNTSPWDLGRAGDIHVRFAIQATGFWGLMPQQLADANAGIHEGYLFWNAAPWFSLAVGRMELNYGDALVIGNVDWHENGRSFDGARARFQIGPGWLDVFGTQLGEGRGGPDTRFGTGDSYFGGLYASFQLVPALTLDPYALFGVTPAWRDPAEQVDEEATTLATLGVRAVGRFAALDYRFEAGVQTGHHRPTPQAGSAPARAYQVDAELGLNLLAGDLRIGLEGFIASGDDPNTRRFEGWNQLYPTAHKWLGLMDVTGPRSNVGGGVLHLKAAPVQPVRLMAQAHVFARPVVTEGVDGYLGSELDVGAAYVIGPGFVARALYGVYVPNTDGPLDDSSAAHYFEIELRFDF